MRKGDVYTYVYDDFCIWTDPEGDPVAAVVHVDLELLDPGAPPTFDPIRGGDPGWAPELELTDITIYTPDTNYYVSMKEEMFVGLFGDAAQDLLNNAIEFGMDEALS